MYKEKAETIKKTCTECKAEKPGSQFAYTSLICKKCKSERDKEEKHRPAEDAPPKTCAKCEKEQPAKQYRYQSRVCLKCEQGRLYEWRKENPDKFKAICKKYRSSPEKRELRNQYLKNKYNDDMNFRLEHLYRCRTRKFITDGAGREKYEKLLGCSWDTLRLWIEENFVAGMTWDNYGEVWHIDHTLPCSIFDFTDEESVKACFNWTNLAPMFGEENLAKSNKVNMALVHKQKEKARTFIKTHQDQILTESLPIDLVTDSGVLDTNVPPKGGAGV